MDRAKAAALESWLRELTAVFEERVLSVDNAVSDNWGRMSAIRPIPVVTACSRRPRSPTG
jgi:hypothetical protein